MNEEEWNECRFAIGHYAEVPRVQKAGKKLLQEVERLREENEFLRMQRETLENQLQHYRGYQ